MAQWDDYTTIRQGPTVLTVMAGDKWALRFTKDGVESNPDVSADAGAKAMFEALKPYLETLNK